LQRRRGANAKADEDADVNLHLNTGKDNYSAMLPCSINFE
jgi:hypothetical protein